ncbi:hypothetical protein NKG94_19975 [Micromonospora sp. M12]
MRYATGSRCWPLPGVSSTPQPTRSGVDGRHRHRSRRRQGHLFRRFGDRIGLIRALYELRGLRLRDALAVSPTRPAAEQAVELLRAMLRFKLDNRVLTLALESAGAAVRTATRRTTTGTPCSPASSRKHATRRRRTIWPTPSSLPSAATWSSTCATGPSSLARGVGRTGQLRTR